MDDEQHTFVYEISILWDFVRQQELQAVSSRKMIYESNDVS